MWERQEDHHFLRQSPALAFGTNARKFSDRDPSESPYLVALLRQPVITSSNEKDSTCNDGCRSG